MANKLERYAKKGMKKLHPLTKFALVVALLLGVAIGAFVCLQFSKNDRFVLKGETAFALDVGAQGSTYVYEEQGLEAFCFGLDVSDKCTVETDLQKDAEGRYIVPTDQEGVYTITYTVDALKFGEKAPNGVIKRIRVFTVSAAEEDGRNG
ncbi:MAG: hypothetical protein E7639_03740 [Ruminococcaceae bacterium]|nr:hypothetical protein [Oscillospiraceae bacterium]